LTQIVIYRNTTVLDSLESTTVLVLYKRAEKIASNDDEGKSAQFTGSTMTHFSRSRGLI